MTKSMDLARNGRPDLFFNEWVYGTQVPRYHFEYQLSPADGGKVNLHTTISQSEVDEHFAMLVPVFADFGEGMVRLAKWQSRAAPASPSISCSPANRKRPP
jgi:hypothetical protein